MMYGKQIYSPVKELTYEEEYKIFCDYIEKNAKEESFLRDYLMSGLAEGNNFRGKLTPRLFRKLFYVNRSDEYEKDIDKRVQDLFNDSGRNVLGICSHGGSGKTVFLKLLSTRIDNPENIEYIVLDMDVNRGSIDPFTIVTQNIIQSLRKWMNKMFSENARASHLLTFYDVINALTDLLEDSSIVDLWKKVRDIIFDEENQEVASKINKLISSFSLDKIKQVTKEEGLQGVQIACLLMMSALLSDQDDNKKYVIIFDNIEAITNKDNSHLPQIIYNTWNLLDEMADKLGIREQFFKRMTFIVSVRTTTDLYVMSSEQYDFFWGQNKKYLFDLHYNDFCAEALSKKLKFLNSRSELRKTKLHRCVELIYSMVCSTTTESTSLIEHESIDFKYYTKHKLSPFFGNNFRQVVMQLCSCIDDAERYLRVETLINSKENWNIVVNGARGILINSIIKNLSAQKTLDYFGIEHLNGTVSHSEMRILLSYLYWSRVQYCLKNKSLKNYQGVSLKHILDIFHYVYKDNISKFIKLIYNLSPFHHGDANKLSRLSELSYLIIINGMESDCSVPEFRRRVEEQDEITIDLSDAGLCYVTSFSTQFEFLNARQDCDALFMTELETNEIFKKYVFEEIILHNYESLDRYVKAMVKNGINGCVFSETDKDDMCQCKYIDWNNQEEIEKLLVCSKFIRYLEVSAAIIECINYVDRYRQFMFMKYKDNDINAKILDLLEKYANLLEYVRSQYNTKNEYTDSVTSSIFFNNETFTTLRNNNLIRLPHKAYFYEGKNGEDKIYKAINFEKEFNIGEDLFKICEKAIV